MVKTILEERLDKLASIIVDEARLKFEDDVVEEILARAIIQVVRIRVEREKLLKENESNA